MDYGPGKFRGLANTLTFEDFNKMLNEPSLIPMRTPTMGQGSPYVVDDVSVPGLAQPSVEYSARDTKQYEGWENKIYKDTEGFDTIGYGHKLTEADKKSGRFKGGITRKEGEALYVEDRARHDKEFYANEPWAKGLSPGQRSALEDMAYNMGPSFLNEWKDTKTALQGGDFRLAASNIRNSKYAQQVHQRALDNANLIYGQ